ncbi:phosphatase domain-containing protein [Aurantiacibacter hainanensis]|uniref:phosphatase domain-containing protein n=1 Tax=Aurantiacibacter hainanensis TaxID=3076114 RepID=UPI0030C6C1CD
MPLLARHPLRVQPYFGHRSRDRLVLSARALRAKPPGFDQRSRLRAVKTMVTQFVSHEMASIPVTLELEGDGGKILEHEGHTNDEGYVHFDVALDPHWDLPEHPAWELGRIRWVNIEGPQVEDVHILAPGRDSRLAVISDIDDTIIETGITGGLRSVMRNWKRVFAQLPHERVPVPGADAFYGQLAGGVLERGEHRPASRIPATKRPFFYISSSPWNLFSYLVAYQRLQGLPLGPLKLRDWGFNRRTLGKSSHGAHKDAAIDGILGMYPDLRFAMIGDDTQGDLPAFARAVDMYPDRVAAVFLRTVSGHTFSPEEEAACSAIRDAGVPIWLGDSYDAGLDFLRTLGFTPGGETEQIVKTVEKVEDAGSPAEEPGPASETA